MTTITEEEEARRGKLLADVLGLKKWKRDSDSTPRYQTDWGSKSDLGLFRTVKRIIKDGE